MSDTCDYPKCTNPILYRCNNCDRAFCPRHSRQIAGEYICDTCYFELARQAEAELESEAVDNLRKGFLRFRNSPQMVTYVIPGEAQDIASRCLNWFASYEAKLKEQETVGRWIIIYAEKSKFWGIGFDNVPHEFLVVIGQEDSASCEVSIGCRYTARGKIDLGLFSKAAKDRIHRIATALEAS